MFPNNNVHLDHKKLFLEHNVLCLDLGSSTGWAIYKNGQLTSGVKKFKKVKDNGEKYCNFDIWLGELLIENRINYVVYEAVNRHVGVYAAHMYGAFECILMMNCTGLSIPRKTFSVTEIKKNATNNGRASKDEVINAVNNYFNLSITDNNEADALAILIKFNDWSNK